MGQSCLYLFLQVGCTPSGNKNIVPEGSLFAVKVLELCSKGKELEFLVWFFKTRVKGDFKAILRITNDTRMKVPSVALLHIPSHL